MVEEANINREEEDKEVVVDGVTYKGTRPNTEKFRRGDNWGKKVIENRQGSGFHSWFKINAQKFGCHFCGCENLSPEGMSSCPGNPRVDKEKITG